jgi:hypothetical protein
LLKIRQVRRGIVLLLAVAGALLASRMTSFNALETWQELAARLGTYI